MSGLRELRELFDATPSTRQDLVGPRRFLWPLMVLVGLVAIAAVTPRFGDTVISVAICLPVLVLAAWSCGPRWTLWFALAAAIVPAFVQPWDMVDTTVGIVARLAIYLVAGLLFALLRTAIDRSTFVAEHDRMTGLLNRSGFLRRLNAEANRARRSRWPIAVGFIDLDNFKQVNDEQGHLAGDEVLRLTARVIDDNIRNYDSAARFGGDEFVVLWPVLTPAGGEDAARRLHGILTAAMENAGWPVRFSLGVAVFETIPDAERVLSVADGLMYDVKKSGKGKMKMQVFQEDDVEDRRA